MGKRKSFSGEVISDKMQKTVIVRVETLKKHPKYGKVVRTFSKFKAHDEKASAKMGDIVSIEETRPISRDKHFRVVEVLKKAPAHIELKEEA